MEREPRPASPVPEALVPYTPEDERRWEEGAKAYGEFVASLSQEKKELLLHGLPEPYQLHYGIQRGDSADIQALFLGERPAAAIDPRLAKACESELNSFGFEHYREGFIYNPQAAERVIDQYPEVFAKQGLTSVNKALEAVSDPKRNDELHAARGLLLGIPYASAQDYEKVNSLRSLLFELQTSSPSPNLKSLSTVLVNNDKKYFPPLEESSRFLNRELNQYSRELHLKPHEREKIISALPVYYQIQRVNMYDQAWWIDFGEYPESQIKQRRITRAFQELEKRNLLVKEKQESQPVDPPYAWPNLD
jgi:hypothetical protein